MAVGLMPADFVELDDVARYPAAAAVVPVVYASFDGSGNQGGDVFKPSWITDTYPVLATLGNPQQLFWGTQACVLYLHNNLPAAPDPAERTRANGVFRRVWSMARRFDEHLPGPGGFSLIWAPPRGSEPLIEGKRVVSAVTRRISCAFSSPGVSKMMNELFTDFLAMGLDWSSGRPTALFQTQLVEISYTLSLEYPDFLAARNPNPQPGGLQVNPGPFIFEVSRPLFSYTPAADIFRLLGAPARNWGILEPARGGASVEPAAKLALLVIWTIFDSIAAALRPPARAEEEFGYNGRLLPTTANRQYFPANLARVWAKVLSLSIRGYSPSLYGNSFVDDLGFSLFTYARLSWARLVKDTKGFVVPAYLSRTRCVRNSLSIVRKWCKAGSAVRNARGPIPLRAYAPRTSNALKHAGAKFFEKLGIENTAEFTSSDIPMLVDLVMSRGGVRLTPLRGPYKFVIHFVDISQLLPDDCYVGAHTLYYLDGERQANPEAGLPYRVIHLIATPGHVFPMVPRAALKGDSKFEDFGASTILHERLIKPVEAKPLEDHPSIFVYDLETLNDGDGKQGNVVPYAAGLACVDDLARWKEDPADDSPEPLFIFQGEDCIQQMLLRLLETPSSDLVYLVAHNGGKFDHFHVIRSILDFPDGPYYSAAMLAQPIPKRGSKILSAGFTLRSNLNRAVSKTVVLRDTILYWPASLSRLGTDLGCETKKGEIAYEDVVSIETYMSSENEQLRALVAEYLRDDVRLLAEICTKLIEKFQELFNVFIFSKMTTASLTKLIYARDYYDPVQFPIYAPSLVLDEDYRRSYTGGKNVNHICGTIDTRNIEAPEGIVPEIGHFDAVSMYPSMMFLYTYPVGKHAEHLVDLDLEKTISWLQENASWGQDSANRSVLFCSLKQEPPDPGTPTAGPQLPARHSVENGPERLLFAWGQWSGWIPDFNLEFLLSCPSLRITDFHCERIHVYTSGRPFQRAVASLFSKKRELDRKLDAGGLDANTVLQYQSLRNVVKLFINSLYGIWAQKTSDTEMLEVVDSVKPGYLQGYFDSHRQCHISEYATQTVLKSRGVCVSSQRNVLLALCITAYARMELYRKEMLAASLPGCRNLYNDTDCLIVFYMRPANRPSFLEELYLEDPRAAVPRELGGWNDENGRGKIVRVTIVGLKCYYYEVETPGKENTDIVMHVRGWNRNWKFVEKTKELDEDGKTQTVFNLNYSEALLKREADKDPGFVPKVLTPFDLDKLVAGKRSRLVARFYNFKAGSRVLLGSPHVRNYEHRSLEVLTNKGRRGELVESPGIRFTVIEPHRV